MLLKLQIFNSILISNFQFVLELSPEQQKILIEIRRKKAELLLEIQVRSKMIPFNPLCKISFKNEINVKNLAQKDLFYQEGVWIAIFSRRNFP